MSNEKGTRGMGIRMRPSEIMAHVVAYVDTALYGTMQSALLLTQATQSADSDGNRDAWAQHAEAMLLASRILETCRNALQDNWAKINGGAILPEDASKKEETTPAATEAKAAPDKKLN